MDFWRARKCAFTSFLLLSLLWISDLCVDPRNGWKAGLTCAATTLTRPEWMMFFGVAWVVALAFQISSHKGGIALAQCVFAYSIIIGIFLN
ncbi:hypothetical protein BCY86_02495 [Pajaroellobacter abortibovis]|uniref:Uncharacterized protein n=1 Tax=Pajaroellobacter abortibovis TaxID=1882918 RepID=A0A1L6MW55_9BACT|nr:hypothetical protein BCY86_02495 [Pajaroellobacter abortibovis]